MELGLLNKSYLLGFLLLNMGAVSLLSMALPPLRKGRVWQVKGSTLTSEPGTRSADELVTCAPDDSALPGFSLLLC